MKDRIQLKALAKINLGLDVLRRREDGYHEVKMIMQTISLHDDLEIRRIKTPEIQVKTNLYYLPTNENNLVYKAAKLLMDEFGIKEGVAIQLKKRIPVAAGMAGGSTDGAAVLWGMNQMYGLGLSRQELMERGVKLGADVPYCVQRGTALAEGIGERLSVLPSMPKCTILIAKPGISVSTKFVYENLHANDLKPEQHPDVDRMIEAMKEKNLDLLCERMGNVLETVTIPAYPVIQEIKEHMMACGAAGAMMSGSGPTVFGIFHSPVQAKAAMKDLKVNGLAKQLYLTTPYNVKR
ncbi:MAG: 4-(cytidine 5'-diphospho)-2-C-methyl-D-erythritol kinase [Lachnospiraceae bacterium]|uniref:4-diphosphocytidyl-2-C-methyl-D-erythritol kinase n=1 Tax=Hominiventricola filiformis TaxID=2885352 RepID=A0AAE3DCI6_9FIRM|nr:4-(cytidine 5'-diphospho)-2-C-methyl-D-erythritol kinase [Hominiventricola filiformis]MCI6880001.1 4-(cytidine 5'-diphospho)-2-C-methyl-D-erythritol kinase [Clostridiaceae bacterium]MDY3825687.1 4-(cytidine 5'-diphospho)-2-C-methyl-D-erythritol kinase [Lachnospiraceae bacterium]QUO23536.1 4-(cytidine 5'-diphospho)-2-C-methyl-D-erythritol kinase [Clostridiaceae bacterium Marseille-Q4143]RHU81782.1 4-(cytidine 5'-diphospho)-2-C-methyl-D-erythritol kinase [Clostridiaceae bacterium OM08-6BH]MCC